MQEYRTAKGWAIFIYITAPLLIILFCYLLVLPFLDNADSPWSLFLILGPVSFGMIIFMAIGLLDTIKGRTIIDDEKIRVETTLSKRELKFEEIKGFRVDDNYIHITSATPDKKSLKISKYVSRSGEIIQWLAEYYPDLDILTVEEEYQEILNNEALGRTIETRETKLKEARKKTRILNWAGGIVAAWTLFWPEPYDLAILTSIAIPILAVITLKFAGGLIKFDENNATAYPSVAVSFMFPSLAIVMRAIADYNIFDHSNAWGLIISVAVIISAVIIFRNREFQFRKAKDYFTVLMIVLFSLVYSYGSIITLNCYYDKSESEAYSAKLINKRISSGKTTTYYLKLTQWGTQSEPDEVSVSKELYDQLSDDDKVTVYYQKGLFDISWYFVTQ